MRAFVGVRAVRVIGVVLVCGASIGANRASAQEPNRATLTKPLPEEARNSREYLSKTELANRFTEIKRRFSEIRAAVGKYAPLRPDAPLDLRVARMKVAAAMRSYALSESEAQVHRDQLNLLIELTPLESLRFNMLMNRLTKMQATITRLMRTMNEAGDALEADSDGAAPARRASR
ncbi:MAG TPA: hypothetical protein VNL39_11155 [Xanthobacteraceae bacterium]|nr:hypothetical protein [Xanthobacteraceae bacterium]